MKPEVALYTGEFVTDKEELCLAIDGTIANHFQFALLSANYIDFVCIYLSSMMLKTKIFKCNGVEHRVDKREQTRTRLSFEKV